MTALEKSKCINMADEIGNIVALTPSLYKALCDTPREIFAPVTRHAYSLDAQPIGGNQWISSPLTVIKMTLALDAENIDNALEIGCGSGYQAAILSHLAHRVFTVERIEKLAAEAKKRFKTLEIHNVHVRFDDGNVGWKSYAPYDRILLSAAARQVPQTLFNQLKNGGILVAPIKKDGKQFIVKFTKDACGKITQKTLEECLFVPLLDGIE